MSQPSTHLRRDVSRWGLVALGISGVVGSGWLYAPMEAVKQAGPGALLAWVVGAGLMLIMGYCLAELACAFPVSGSSAQVSSATHGRGMSLINMWLLFFAYVTTPSIEATSIVTYSAMYFPQLTVGKEANLSHTGQVATVLLIAFFTVLNFFGVRWLIRMNSVITWWKIAIPASVGLVLMFTKFDSANLTSNGEGFMPGGVQSIFAALSMGGIVFTLCGFRIIGDLAGEAKNPAKDIPFAFFMSTLFALVLYLIVQLAFLGALDTAEYANGWKNIVIPQANAPFLAILMVAGLPLLVKVLYFDAVISPGGSCLAYVGSTGRVVYAAAQQRFAWNILLQLNKQGVPVLALVFSWFVSSVVVFAYPKWTELANLNAAAYFLNVISVPVSVVVLRRIEPRSRRPFQMPGGMFMAFVAFASNLLIVYWSGVKSYIPVIVALCVIVFCAYALPKLRGKPQVVNAWKPLAWLVPTALVVIGVGWFGSEDFGGTGDLKNSMDTLIIAVLSVPLFWMATHCAQPSDQVRVELEHLRAEVGADSDAGAAFRH